MVVTEAQTEISSEVLALEGGQLTTKVLVAVDTPGVLVILKMETVVVVVLTTQEQTKVIQQDSRLEWAK